MRLEVAGAQITDTIVEVLDTLQNQPDLTKVYLQALDDVTRIVILDLSGDDADADLKTLSQLRALQMVRRDIATLSTPPDSDLPENDIPVASL